MSLSFTPRTSSFFPGFPRWSDIERDIDRDISRMQHMFDHTAQRFLSDKHGVHHRQPNYTYEETDQHAEIEIELPGVSKDQVTVDLRGDTLVVSAKRYKTSQLLHPVQVVPVEKKTLQTDGSTEEHKGEPDTEMTQDDSVKQSQEAQEKPQPKLCVVYDVSIPIDNKFDVDNIGATMLGDGILTMHVPKRVHSSTASRMIQIGSGSE